MSAATASISLTSASILSTGERPATLLPRLSMSFN
jgi:hypothetical protein